MSISTAIMDEAFSIIVPLKTEVHQIARQFAAEQNSFIKGKQVYLNTLAVVALHTYLGWLDLSSDLDASYSWHPLQRSAFDRADLYIPDIGRIDCVLALPGATTAESPLASEDTIAQVLVQFEESLASVRLTGYCLVIGEPEEVVSTDPEQGWFEIEQLPETLLRLQMAFDYLDTAEDAETQRLQEEMTARGLNWSGVMTMLMANWDKPSLLRSQLFTFLESDSSSQDSALVTLRSPQDELEEEGSLDRLETCLKNIRDAIEDVLNPSSSEKNAIEQDEQEQKVIKQSLGQRSQGFPSCFLPEGFRPWAEFLTLISENPVPIGSRSGSDKTSIIEQGWKEIDLKDQSVALVITVEAQSEQERVVFVKVIPMPTQTYLRPGLKLVVSVESDGLIEEEQARSNDKMIMLDFLKVIGTQFEVHVSLDNTFFSTVFSIS
jgi:hypothetical protein